MDTASTLAVIGIVPPTLLALTGLVVALSNLAHLQHVDAQLTEHLQTKPVTSA